MIINKYRVLDIKTGLETDHEFDDSVKPLPMNSKLELIYAWNKVSGMKKRYRLVVE